MPVNMDNVRRFVFRVTTTSGKEYEFERVCLRPIPPTREWVTDDQASLIYRLPVANIPLRNGMYVSLQTSNIESIELVEAHEGLDVEEVRKRYDMQREEKEKINKFKYEYAGIGV